MVIIYNNSMTVHVQVFVWVYIFNLLVYVYPGVRFLDHVVHRCLNSEGLLRPFSKSAASILCFIILYCTSTYEDLRVWISSYFCQPRYFPSFLLWPFYPMMRTKAFAFYFYVFVPCEIDLFAWHDINMIFFNIEI